MIEVRCPRCKQYWYSNEDNGRVRLCSRCVDYVRQKRRARGEIDIVFLFGLAIALFFDLLLMLLTALMPTVFGKIAMILAMVKFVGGIIVLRFSQGVEGWYNPHVGRWGLLMMLSALILGAGCGALMGLRL
jgi:hypothetical protein